MLLLWAILVFADARAQVFVNAHVFVGNAEIHVSKAGGLNGVVIGQNGTIENRGAIFLDGDWENRNASAYAVFSSDSGLVNLNGANQSISGQPTDFNFLETSGSGIKSMETDASVSTVITLNDRELATQDYTLRILDPTTTSIRSEVPLGFISNNPGTGWVQWKTTLGEYYFPLGGTTTGELRYHPLILSPQVDEEGEFKVRYVDNDPTEDGYDSEAMGEGEGELCSVNPNFYHEVLRVAGQGAVDMGIVHFAQIDGRYNSIAHWNSDHWQINDSEHGSLYSNWGFGENSVTSFLYNDFSFQQYALSFDECDLYIPNVFSPNLDGNNDQFFIRGKGIGSIDLVIYDRWGEKVFVTDDILLPWDGTFKGQPMAPAVFVYSVNVKFLTGKTISRTGNLTLLR